MKPHCRLANWPQTFGKNAPKKGKKKKEEDLNKNTKIIASIFVWTCERRKDQTNFLNM